MLVDASRYRRLEGYRDEFFLFYEDRICPRAGWAARRSSTCPQATIRHHYSFGTGITKWVYLEHPADVRAEHLPGLDAAGARAAAPRRGARAAGRGPRRGPAAREAARLSVGVGVAGLDPRAASQARGDAGPARRGHHRALRDGGGVTADRLAARAPGHPALIAYRTVAVALVKAIGR